MAPNDVSHRRTHNLLLISKLLNLREGAAPLTLVQDSLEQPAAPLLKEYIRRTKLSKGHVTFVSFDTLTRPAGADTFINAAGKPYELIAEEVTSSYTASQPTGNQNTTPKRYLVIVDSVHPLLSPRAGAKTVYLPEYLSSLLGPASPHVQVSLVLVYHRHIPSSPSSNPYAPSPLSLLTYLATTIITTHSMSQMLARKAAIDRSLAPPVFGLEEEVDGVLIGRVNQHLKGGKQDGIVLEMEHRRKSGRGIVEWYFLPHASKYSTKQVTEVVILLDDHPLYKRKDTEVNEEAWEPESTFELGLTERQRRERDNVVLPYFDAQKGNGPGEGGRILYDMGEEDDFDEEEDEI
ncbi:hypothetical protein H112_08694 [Trichophyton rubrum D6]|uniref:Elongator complex protein 5 n=5 Tax=Trichophyton TaxID=5550 RepID=A0A178ERX6_TRIRU|nr:uncharacterized protein TERG_01245 [Trichophyton rubrum CBS 118892]EZF09966.1 hypothetical protein H100_08716 [Trichophyton rubrum MR850]EZF36820.1 hypothetical protein H102_08675 [Trichophyton rubrum CBS 100081]EZF47416.1 hypothetical protein H103_08698 [Trichophyton rubrum CBS 288.86]EZF58074.1 hypothetical protein H104_08650 [Trichophyton rubrum CBS 289.86]EZF68681.1 hypothetical protein H105_08702 [Trichophyton soudanense CBS 452.61]EZF79374.1 hypothetical protein H110_08700 [Trichophy